ncbi:ABC transporter substrate-binding protein [Variovorax paradoxus]|jgi:glutamate/aspartate transport system substrate-binding protein|uniref:transporter substrate-binding domain-containing protein n=1 Tax=Variovorax TaxID=34072 RepID=UPI0006E5E567|nr:transporter substrate-binding domain-containing protein [Variovorax sp.]KPU96217.1 ABC transporter substrate-binding protein [Variovorax paradoxus]KPV08571.1 ABC transporter substrate-binding protein [Variovorax paradoxus]KPV13597.1 ABC transporter substrate-binding protein [Variovorax paradoxus]KPV23472.1 ABC transporter substrate-binding protein [Variovorax paradoxus]KPV36439.1 ABC transporter substrate-binding protein [Variovorax paradoxus]|eukprot:TRINITY_DN26714_c0_g7_i1.p3 TRINITY_DN26714_c0_g7~~TRINITY_DN26714_c0_g7_i1.p3  ORF type:complete len:296 (+),score=94.17 TRINITY_DN26714_c0_g7_i1:61-948(+)
MKLSALMAAAATVLLAATGAQAADTLAKIAESGKITLAYRESSVPFSYLDGPNKPIGFAVEMSNAVVEAVKKKLNKPNLQVQLMAVTSQNRIPLITNGTVDLECGSTTNNTARGKDVSFAVNHFYTGTRLLVKKSSKIKDYADLAKKTVASTTGTTNALVMRKYNTEKNLDMNIVLGKDHADAFLLVESDRAVAFAMDDILLFGLIANSKNPADYEVVGESLQVEPYACMLPKDDPAFKKLVDDTFIGMMKSGEFEKLYTKWFMSPIPPKNLPLNLPMSPQLKENLKEFSDKPAT